MEARRVCRVCVLDDTGRPVPDAQVAVVDGPRKLEGTTDESGNCEFSLRAVACDLFVAHSECRAHASKAFRLGRVNTVKLVRAPSYGSVLSLGGQFTLPGFEGFANVGEDEDGTFWLSSDYWILNGGEDGGVSFTHEDELIVQDSRRTKAYAKIFFTPPKVILVDYKRNEGWDTSYEDAELFVPSAEPALDFTQQVVLIANPDDRLISVDQEHPWSLAKVKETEPHNRAYGSALAALEEIKNILEVDDETAGIGHNSGRFGIFDDAAIAQQLSDVRQAIEVLRSPVIDVPRVQTFCDRLRRYGELLAPYGEKVGMSAATIVGYGAGGIAIALAAKYFGAAEALGNLLALIK